MEYTKSIANGILACMLAGAVAAPAFGADSPADKAAYARLAGEKAAAAAKAAADIRQGLLPRPPKGSGANFNPATMKLFADRLDAILAEMKGVTTPQQAVAYSDKFKNATPEFENNLKRVMAAFAAYLNSGEKTPDNTAAEKMLNDAGPKAEAIDKEMERIEKLNPAAKAAFQKFRDLHN